jgi:transposase-like protein
VSRPPALTIDQQDAVRKRLAAGEGVRALAREYGVGTATIRRQAAHTAQVRNVAEKLADAHTALPPMHQAIAVTLAEQLREVSESMAGAAVLAAGTSRHLHRLAHQQAAQVTSENLEQSHSRLQTVAGLTKLANEAAAIPLGLMSSNKDRLPQDPPPAPPALTVDPALLSDQVLHELLRAKQGA